MVNLIPDNVVNQPYYFCEISEFRPLNINTTIVLLRTNYGKLILKPFAINKLLLPVFGAVLYSWTGFFVGLVFGIALDMRFIAKPPHSHKPHTGEIRLQSLMLAMYIIQVSGTMRFIVFEEILKRLEQVVGGEFIRSRRMFIRELSRQKIQVTPICEHLKKILSQEQRKKLLKDIAGCAYFTQIDTEKLRRAVYAVGAQLNLTSAEIDAVYSGVLVKQDGLKQYFDILGISPLSDYRDTKKAYLALVKKYHPDTAIHKTFSEQQLMSEKFRQTKEAYVRISKAKGWK